MALPQIEIVVSADTKRAEAGLDRAERSIREFGASTRASDRSVDQFSRRLSRQVSSQRRFQLGVQNAAFQINDFATQVGAGTMASIALGQQLPQLLQGFGLFGAVLSAVVAVGVPLTRILNEMKTEGESLTQIFGTLQPVAIGIAEAFSSIAEFGREAAVVILNNLDRILITGGVVATFFAGRWVAAFVAARVATFSLAGALVTLRAALLRTGIGALVLGIGELVYQFSRLVGAVGSFGEALRLIGRVGLDAMQQIGDKGGRVLVLGLQSAFKAIEAAFRRMIANMQEAIANFFHTMRKGFAAIPGMEGVADTLGVMAIDLRSAAGAQRGVAGADGFQPGTAIGADEASASYGSQAAGLIRGALGEMESLQELRAILASIKDEGLDIPSLLGAGTAEGEGSGGKSAAQKAADDAIDQVERIRMAQEMLRNSSRGVWSELGSLIQQFAGKSKAAAIAAIAIQKGLSIAQIVANTAAAQMRALAELGPIAGPPVASKIGLYGKLQAGLVAATGLAQAAGGRSAGGGGGLSGAGVVGAQQGGGNRPTQNVVLDLVGATPSQAEQFQTFADTLTEMNRSGYDLSVFVKGA